MFRMAALFVCVTFSLWAGTAHAVEPLKSSRFMLSNGLHVEVLYQPKAPIVTHMMWFYAGRADEGAGKSGVAHYLEHMMFKGTPKHPEGTYEAIVERMGGQQNAFTSDDFTAYYATVAREKLPDLMALESDRLQHIKPASQSYAGELQVVMEERRMRTDNDPSARMREQLDARLFAPHPYAIPVIGWMHEIAKLTEQDVLNFFRQHYGPKNAVLLLVGDITERDARKLAQTYYGSWHTPATRSARAWQAPQPLKTMMPIAIKDGNVSQPQWQRRYLAPSLGHGDKKQVFALIVLAQFLCGSDASVLYQDLVVKQKKLTSLSCGYDAFMLGAGSMSFNLIPAQGVSLQEAGEALDASMKKIIEGAEDRVALGRAKNSLKVETIYARDGVASMAFLYGQLMMLGLGVDFFNGWEEAITKVSWAQIQHAAKDVVLDGTHITGWILPDGTKPKNARGASTSHVGMGDHVR